MKTRRACKIQINSLEEAQMLEEFTKAAVFQEAVPRDVIFDLIKGWLRKNRPRQSLATQGEMLDALASAGLGTNQAILLKHRLQGYLRKDPKKPATRDGSDRLWRENRLGNVVYLRDSVINHFMQRQGKGTGGWLNRTGTSATPPKSSRSGRSRSSTAAAARNSTKARALRG